MKPIFVASLLFYVPMFLQAQNRGPNQEIEAYKVAWLTQKLELSPDEAKIFWPIYNDWQREQLALRKERVQNLISFRKTTEIDDLSDSQVQTLITNEFNFKQRDLNIEKKYYNLLKSNLPIKVVGKYYRAQETFKKELLSRYQRGPGQKG